MEFALSGGRKPARRFYSRPSVANLVSLVYSRWSLGLGNEIRNSRVEIAKVKEK